MRHAAAALLGLALVAASARAADSDWEVRVPAEAAVQVGEVTTVSLAIAGLDGRVVSKDGPVRVELSSATLKLPRTRYERRHAADPAADAPRFDLKLSAPDTGDHDLAIEVRFWLCAAKTCRPVRTQRTVTIRAAAPPNGT